MNKSSSNIMIIELIFRRKKYFDKKFASSEKLSR